MAIKKSQRNKSLTGREHDVAHLMCEGLSNKLIAVRLDLSNHTIKFHITNIIIKMGANTRVDAAVKFALAVRQDAKVDA